MEGGCGEGSRRTRAPNTSPTRRHDTQSDIDTLALSQLNLEFAIGFLRDHPDQGVLEALLSRTQVLHDMAVISASTDAARSLGSSA